MVIDTNVIVSALRFKRGAAYRLLMLVDSGKFTTNISIPLIFEYEHATKDMVGQIALSAQDIDDILDYICYVAERQAIFFLWRPFLKDPNDDMVLELAVAVQCDCIITYNVSHFLGTDQFGMRVRTAKEFLQEIGEIP